MKCNEMNTKGLREIDVETPLAEIVPGSGTYDDIAVLVNAGKIELLKDAQDEVVGISVISGKTGAEDSLEGEKFAKKFDGCDVMAWIYHALTGRSMHASSADLPAEVELSVEDDLRYGSLTDSAVARALREKYDHYLSGFDYPQFQVDHEPGADIVKVTGIRWGRKR